MRVPHTRGIELDGLHHTWFRYEGSRTREDEPTMLVRGNKFNGCPHTCIDRPETQEFQNSLALSVYSGSTF